jgi:hypothetical protein
MATKNHVPLQMETVVNGGVNAEEPVAPNRAILSAASGALSSSDPDRVLMIDGGKRWPRYESQMMRQPKTERAPRLRRRDQAHVDVSCPWIIRPPAPTRIYLFL